MKPKNNSSGEEEVSRILKEGSIWIVFAMIGITALLILLEMYLYNKGWLR